MHDQEFKIKNAVNRKYMIADIVFKVITGILTGSTIASLVSNSNYTSDMTFIYIFTGISLVFQLVSGVLTGIRETSDFNGIALQHSSASSKFGEINLNIQEQLALNIDDRDPDKEFLNTTIKSFNDIYGSVPPIGEKTKQKYIASDEDNEIYNPIIVGDYNNLQLVDKKNDSKKDDDDTGAKAKYEIDRWLSRF